MRAASRGEDVWELTRRVDEGMVTALLALVTDDDLEASARDAVEARGGATMSDKAREEALRWETAHRVRERFGAPDLMEALLALDV